jgi:hypothetical protein
MSPRSSTRSYRSRSRRTIFPGNAFPVAITSCYAGKRPARLMIQKLPNAALLSRKSRCGGDTRVGLASYLFPMDLACEQGCASVNLAVTVPVLTDGVFSPQARLERSGGTAHPRPTASCSWAGEGPCGQCWTFWRRRPWSTGQAIARCRGGGRCRRAADPRTGALLRRALLADGLDWLTITAEAGWRAPAPGELPPSAVRLTTASTSAVLAIERAA